MNHVSELCVIAQASEKILGMFCACSEKGEEKFSFSYFHLYELSFGYDAFFKSYSGSSQHSVNTGVVHFHQLTRLSFKFMLVWTSSHTSIPDNERTNRSVESVA